GDRRQGPEWLRDGPEAADIDSWADPAPLRRAAALNGTPALPPPVTP
ncbi:M20 family peptidase, partial [Streptomyces griseus]|nr:M20 family peptidase [Streptomyces griseus]